MVEESDCKIGPDRPYPPIPSDELKIKEFEDGSIAIDLSDLEEFPFELRDTYINHNNISFTEIQRVKEDQFMPNIMDELVSKFKSMGIPIIEFEIEIDKDGNVKIKGD